MTRRFTNEFKREAMALWETSGRMPAEVSCRVGGHADDAAPLAAQPEDGSVLPAIATITLRCRASSTPSMLNSAISVDGRHKSRRGKRCSGTLEATATGTASTQFLGASHPSKPSTACPASPACPSKRGEIRTCRAADRQLSPPDAATLGNVAPASIVWVR